MIIALGRALSLYISVCTVITAFIMLIQKIYNKFFKTPEQRKQDEIAFDELANSNSEEMITIRRIFGDINDDSVQLLIIAIVTYIPGMNVAVWWRVIKGYFER